MFLLKLRVLVRSIKRHHALREMLEQHLWGDRSIEGLNVNNTAYKYGFVFNEEKKFYSRIVVNAARCAAIRAPLAVLSKPRRYHVHLAHRCVPRSVSEAQDTIASTHNCARLVHLKRGSHRTDPRDS